MKIAIIETGKPPEPIRAHHKSYPEMFVDLLNREDMDSQFTTFSICDGQTFPEINAYDAFLITGSPAGVYEDHSWLPPLFTFIRDVAEANKPQIGICFGHQAIAQALGGEVTKSPKGWGIGRHTYSILQHPRWLSEENEFSLAVSHQDQVITQPLGAQILAQSEFCEFAALYYPDAPALTFQGHPEFSNQFSADLYNIRRGSRLEPEFVDQAITSLESYPDNNELVAKWIWQFLNHVS